MSSTRPSLPRTRHPAPQSLAMAAGLVASILLAACGRSAAPAAGAGGAVFTPSPATTTTTSTPAPPVTVPSSTCDPVAIDAGAFPPVPNIDNRFQPLLVGAHWVLTGYVLGLDGRKHPHRIETTVTDMTAVIEGVHATTLFERDFEDDQLQEAELFFVAQDREGAIWELGQYPELYSEGEVSGTPYTWIAGVAGAKAGVIMPAHPKIGAGTYMSGLAPQINYWDCATVVNYDQRQCVPTGCYNGVIVIDEFAPNARAEGHQRKYYAPGVGPIRVGAAGGVDPETLLLTKTANLCAGDLETIRNLTVEEDQRGRSLSSATYGELPPLQQTPSSPAC